MKKIIMGLLVLTIFICSGCGGGGGSDVSEKAANSVSTEETPVISVPENVTVTPAGISRKAATATPFNTANEITWDDVDGALYYNIYWLNETPVTTDTGNIISDVTSPYIHSGLDSDPTLTYYYIVTAVGDSGEGPASNEANALPVAKPQNVTAEASDATIRVRWDEVTGATSYNIYWLNTAEVTTGTGTQISVAAATGRHSYTHENLTNNAGYYYIITAIDPAGEGSASTEVSAIPTAERLSAPTNISTTAGNTSTIISWDELQGANSYNLYWLNSTGVTAGNGNLINITPADPANPQYTHSNLTNGLAYYYIVTGVDDVGEGADSAEATATPMPPIPSAPANLAATRGNTENTITWNSVSGATSYNIYWLDSTGVTTVNGAPLTSVTSPYIHSGLTNYTGYYYIVTAVNMTGESVASTEVTATPVAPPDNVSIVQGDSSNTITWDTVGGATSYNLYWLNAAGVTKGTGNVVSGIATTSFTHSSLTNNLSYYYIVSAVDGIGEGLASSEVYAIPIAQPSNVAVAAGNTDNTITWDAVTGAASYNLYWLENTSGVTTSNGNVINITQVDPDPLPTSYTQSPLTNGSDYYYIITAVNATGQSPASAEVTAMPVAPPETPTTVVATPANTVNTITWGAMAYATSYNIYWGTETGVTPTKIAGITSPYTHTGLTNGDEIFYIVTAENVSGESTASGEVSATPDAPLPAAPLNPAATPGNAENEITWSAVDGAATYNIYWGTTSGATTTQIAGQTSPYTHTGLTNGDEIFYTVTAVNDTGEGLASSEVSATPSAPTATINATPGNASNTITWGDVAGAVSYNIYWLNTTGVTPGTGNAITGVSSSFTHSDLTNGLIYYYVATAVDGTGERSASAEVSATPIAPPANVTSVAGNAENVITWDGVTGATGYTISWNNSGSVTIGENLLSGVTITSPYTHSPLANDGTEYFYIVTAVNATGQSQASAEVSATPLAPPAIPTTVVATAGNRINIITWDSMADATSYNVYWGTATGVTPTKIAGVSSPYTHASLTNTTEYFYIVTAENGSGESATSAEVSATPGLPLPAAPLNVTATPGDGENIITWNDVDGATLYNIHWGTASGVITGTFAGQTSPYTHSGLINSTEIFYTVTAENATGEGLASSEVSATPIAAPATPTTVVATAANTVNTITWDTMAGATSYNIYWGTATGVTPTKIAGATSPYTHSGLSNGTEYFYIVSSENSSGESAASGEVSATPAVSLPGIPTNVTATADDTQNILIWDSVTGATSYNIYWNTAGSVPTTGTPQITPIATNSYTHPGLTNGTTYYYKITANNVTGEGLASAEVSATPIMPIPSKPVNVTATPGNLNNTIIWDESEGATSYNIYWATATGVTTSTGTLIEDVTNPYAHTENPSGLTVGDEYFYIVTAVNSSGESSASDEVSAIVLYPHPVTDTGQATCYDDLEELVDCPTTDIEAFYGQDGNYTINPQTYTKLDSDGNVLPLSTTSWAMVRDSGTGLIWEVKSDDDGTQDKDNTYTWTDANTFVDDLNTVSFGRFSDWRLPTVKELKSIVDNSKSTPSINDFYFLNTKSSGLAYYWTSTEFAKYNTDHAWHVHFAYGVAAQSNKAMEHYVRAVRGGP